MLINKEKYTELLQKAKEHQAILVAVSKTKPVEAIKELYDLGHRDFGENYVQELVTRYEQLPKDIRWHFIGHLQSNKVKYIVPFVHLIHGVDSFKLLQEINKQAVKISRSIDVLLQVHIASEETKFGMDEQELKEAVQNYGRLMDKKVLVRGLMGMASFTNEQDIIKKEFGTLKNLFDHYAQLKTMPAFSILSMGMSSDYELALQQGSTMIRVGSLIFGERNYVK